MKKILVLFLATLVISFTACTSKKSESTEEAETADESHEGMDMGTADASEGLGADAELTDDMNVFFGNIEDGSTQTSPVHVEMGVSGMEVEPAGELAKYKGHHHIIVDGTFVPKGEIVPTDSTHIHFGQGQTSTDVELSPGPHTLTLQFADGFHRSYGEKMSATVNIEVE